LTISNIFSWLLTSTNGSLILRGVSSESHRVYCWVTSSVTTAYAPIQVRLSYSRYATPEKHQGYLEAHWMYGRPQPLHLMTRREGPAFLQIALGIREVCLVGGGRCCLHIAKRVRYLSSSPYCSSERRCPFPLCCSH
jgi:hypothetical protein